MSKTLPESIEDTLQEFLDSRILFDKNFSMKKMFIQKKKHIFTFFFKHCSILMTFDKLPGHWDGLYKPPRFRNSMTPESSLIWSLKSVMTKTFFLYKLEKKLNLNDSLFKTIWTDLQWANYIWIVSSWKDENRPCMKFFSKESSCGITCACDEDFFTFQMLLCPIARVQDFCSKHKDNILAKLLTEKRVKTCFCLTY